LRYSFIEYPPIAKDNFGVKRQTQQTTIPQTFYIYARRCPRRRLDATRLYAYFVNNGLTEADDPKKADLIAVYTCGGFTATEETSVLTIKDSIKKGAKVIITGCLPKINPGKLSPFIKTAKIIPIESLSQLDSLINAKVHYSEIPNQSIVRGVNDLLVGTFTQRFKKNFRTNQDFLQNSCSFLEKKFGRKNNLSLGQKYFKIEIARGCLGNCSYCIIKKAMEKFHSYPEEQIVDTFRIGLTQGYSNFALMAGDIGCYGLDINTNLPNLLTKLFEEEGNYAFFLVDLNPRWLREYYSDLLSVLKANEGKVSKIMVPIQSGSNRILKMMNRQYEIDEVKRYLLDIHRNLPEIKIETHLIVGFPGETNEDFEESKKLLKDLDFAKVHIYKYEDRPGTDSVEFPEKIPRKEVFMRSKILAKEKQKDKNVIFGVDGL
jgi:threonylcarbamoyladenosine tRNA methylthiotransferase CDKAL1